jgi:hypothetical protein
VGEGGSFLLYFVTIGLAFMLVEISLIQKYALYLGHPVYSLAVVLFSLLVAGAAGSLLSQRLRIENLARGGAVIVAVLAVLIVGFVALHPGLFDGTYGLSKTGRIAVALLTVMPLGLLMGMPLPIGVRALEWGRPKLVPWAWGLNSASSVTGAVLAFVLALNLGFARAIALGSFLYVAASVMLAVRARAGRCT